MRRPIYPCTLLLVILSAVAARAQGPGMEADLGDPTARPPADLVEQKPAVIWPPQTGPSSYTLYEQAPGSCCCGPIGGCGPLRMELFVDTGPSIACGNDFLARSLDTGWTVSGGARALFFNRAETAAWNVDVSLNYTWNHGNHPEIQTVFPVGINGLPVTFLDTVTVANLYRTYGGVGLGREWFLLGPTFTGNTNWIAGVDGGFRYGVARIDLHDLDNTLSGFVRTTDQLYGGYVGFHTDLEIPHNCCTYLVGLRAEWSAMELRSGMLFNTINDQHIFDVNLMFTLGVRF